MNIAEVIMEIEDNPNATERVISYSEVILHLKDIKQRISFGHYHTEWMNDVNKAIIAGVHKDIDKQITELLLLIDSNIKK